jgi:hypothetical protein
MTASLVLLTLIAADPQPKETPKPVNYEKQLNEKLSKGITAQDNANALLWQVFGPKPEGAEMPPEYYKWLGIDPPPEKGDYFINSGKFIREHLLLQQEEFEDVFNQQGWASARPWSAMDYPFIGAWLNANEKPLALVHEAVRRPGYYNPLVTRKNGDEPGMLIGVLLPSVQKCRELASALTARAMLRLREGKTDEAWADLLACHRLARHLGHGGTLIELLVAIAIEAVASNSTLAFIEHANLDSKQLLAKLKDLQSLPPMPTIADKIDVTERTMFLDSLSFIERGHVNLFNGLLPGNIPDLSKEELEGLKRIDWEPARENAMRYYDRMVAGLRLKTRAARNQQLDSLETELKKLKETHGENLEELRKSLFKKDAGPLIVKAISDVLIALLAPAVHKVQDASDRSLQIETNLQVAFALGAYKADHGLYPTKLSDLAPKYLPTIPGDVFSGKDLIYKPEKAGYLFYSVGANGQDDGGRWYDDEPRGDDPRVRMPLPPLKKD